MKKLLIALLLLLGLTALALAGAKMLGKPSAAAPPSNSASGSASAAPAVLSSVDAPPAPTVEELLAQAHTLALQAAAQPQSPATPAEESKAQGLLLLANKQHPLAADFAPDDLVRAQYVAPNRSEVGFTLRAEAAEHIDALMQASRSEAGHAFVVTTAYRSYAFQQQLWDSYVARDGEEAAARYSARPGTSEHQGGLSADVSVPELPGYALDTALGDLPAGIWLAENAHRFGFIIRFPKNGEEITGYMYEPWHLRYVGKDAAAFIDTHDITLEEYLIYLELAGN